MAVQGKRVLRLNDAPKRDGRYVLYWMQAAQRAEYNHALEYAIEKANELNQPLLAVFGLTDDYPDANLRHYHFMLEGLTETRLALEKRGIQLIILHESPDTAAIELAKDASLLIADAGHLKIQRKWRQSVAEKVDCRMLEVETNLIVPIEVASEKENFSAGTLRPRIHKVLDQFLVPLRHKKLKKDSLGLKFKSFDISDIEKALKKLKIDRSIGPSPFYTGGTSVAKQMLKDFISNKLPKYNSLRNDPSLDYQSNMSPYLHFGHISPLYIALELSKSKSKDKKAYLEELIVRRELSHNFVYYNSKYDQYDGLPPWALRTLNFHAKDKREYDYSLRQFESAQTHDPYWNAAQYEMVLTGKMHGYMRMYWGKKILEWSQTPQKAFETALYLNNKYELDGRDPNGYTGVAWCFGKHDRAWAERDIFGKVRYMNAAGLKRKFDIDRYVEKVEKIRKELGK